MNKYFIIVLISGLMLSGISFILLNEKSKLGFNIMEPKEFLLKKVFEEGVSPVDIITGGDLPRWPLENPPPVAGSKSPTPRQQNKNNLVLFLS